MPSSLITLFSDIQQPLSLNEKQRIDILSLKKVLGSQNVNLQADDTLSIRNQVGFISKGTTRIQILPKIFKDDEVFDIDEEKQASIKLLLNLLSYSGFMNIKDIPEPQSIEGCSSDLLEIFIAIFSSKFLTLIRRDVHRSYETTEENQQFIKGKILFSKSLLKNSYRKHIHYVQYDEFTIDTLLNSIFKTVVLNLLSRTTNSKNKMNLQQALVCLEDVETIELFKGIFERVKFNRLNDEYRPLFNMARLFYYNQQPGYTEGDEYTFTFLVPLNKLFEYYIYKILDDIIIRDDLKVNYQKPQKRLASSNEKKHFQLQPDITISERGQITFILDAKFKNPLYKSDTSLTATDIYQIVTYAVAYECDKVFLVYPYFKGALRKEPILESYEIENRGIIINIKIVQVDITAPVDEVANGLLEALGLNQGEIDSHKKLAVA